LGLIVAGYDGFPRGEVTQVAGQDRFVIRHSRDFTRDLRVTRREIEEAFGIRGNAVWAVDEELDCAATSAKRLRGLLSIEEKWTAP
jgi:hypothetical protein